MVLTLPVTGRFKADGDNLPEHRTNCQELHRTGMANHHANISVRRSNTKTVGQQTNPRHAVVAIQ